MENYSGFIFKAEFTFIKIELLLKKRFIPTFRLLFIFEKLKLHTVEFFSLHTNVRGFSGCMLGVNFNLKHQLSIKRKIKVKLEESHELK